MISGWVISGEAWDKKRRVSSFGYRTQRLEGFLRVWVVIFLSLNPKHFSSSPFYFGTAIKRVGGLNFLRLHGTLNDLFLLHLHIYCCSSLFFVFFALTCLIPSPFCFIHCRRALELTGQLRLNVRWSMGSFPLSLSLVSIEFDYWQNLPSVRCVASRPSSPT